MPSARRPPIDLYQGMSPIDVPFCSIKDAAQWLGVPRSTADAWVRGQTKSGFKPVIRIADKKHGLLSFQNLVELHVLAAIRRDHGVTLPRIRKAVDFLEKRLGVKRPLASSQMLTDGRDLLIEWHGEYLNASERGQTEFRQVLNAFLTRIECDDKGTPIRLYPLARRDIHSPCTIVIDPTVQFGRPCVAGTGIPTAEIVDRYTAGESMQSLAQDFGRTIDEIEDAIRYEFPRDLAA